MKLVITGADHPVVKAAAERLVAIFDAIIKERSFQSEKYGTVVTADYEKLVLMKPDSKFGGHELAAWLLILRKELHEAEDAVVHGGFQSAKGRNTIRSELVQIAAVAVAALEQHGIEEPRDPSEPQPGSVTFFPERHE